jgi:uncharacterized protein YdhG (YjbR/CyaY superfamily)
MPTKPKKFTGFSDEERAAMRERALELKVEARMTKNRAEGEKILLAAIAKMPEPDRAMAKKFHTIVTKHAPTLMPKTWYGMPAWAEKSGKVVCFFQSAAKFQARYTSFGFTDAARLDDGNLWPTYFGLKKMTPAEEKKIAELVKKAVS